MFLFFIIAAISVNAACCANPAAGIQFFCQDASISQCCPEADTNCAENYYSELSCNQFEKCEPVCCCSPFNAFGRKVACLGDAFSYPLDGATCKEKCGVVAPAADKDGEIAGSPKASDMPKKSYGSIHTGPAICDGKPEGRDYLGNAIDSGWVELIGSDNSSLLIIGHDDCKNLSSACPEGYTAKGSIHTGPGKCDGRVEGSDYLGNPLDSGWMILCSNDSSTFFGVAFDDCAEISINCPSGFASTGKLHSGPGKCDGRNESYDSLGHGLDSGWVSLCTNDSGGLFKSVKDDCIAKSKLSSLKKQSSIPAGSLEIFLPEESAEKCEDGTLVNTCSDNKPLYCYPSGFLIGDCQKCGCPNKEDYCSYPYLKCETECEEGHVTSTGNNDVLCYNGEEHECTESSHGELYNVIIHPILGYHFDALCTRSILYLYSDWNSFVECNTKGNTWRTGNGETADSGKMSYDKQFVCLETDDQEIWVKCGEEPPKPDGTLLTKGQSIWSKGTTYYCCDNKWQTTGCGSGSIHGTVNDKTTGQPVKNARIDVSYTGSDKEVNKLRTFSDQEGNYEAEDLPVGTYWIFATPNDQIYPRGFTKVEIIENQDTLANIDMLDISGSISGKVATGSGSPLQNVRVEIIFDKVPVISFSENTDKNGYYEKGFLFDSETYVVRVTAPKYKKQEIRVQAVADAKADFHLLKSYRILFVPIETSQVTKERETFYEQVSIAAVSGAGLFKSMSPFSEIDSLETHVARNFCDCSTYEVQIEEGVYSGCMQKVLQCAKEENPNEKYHAIIAITPYTSDSHSGASIPFSNVIFAGLIGVQGYDAAETIVHELFHKQKLCDEREKSAYDRQNVRYRFSRIYDQPLWDFSGCMNEYPLNTGIGPYEPMNQDNCQMDCSKDKSYCEKATCGTKLGREAPPYDVSIMGGTPRVDGLTGEKEYYLTGIPPDSYEKLKKLIKDWAYK